MDSVKSQFLKTGGAAKETCLAQASVSFQEQRKNEVTRLETEKPKWEWETGSAVTEEKSWGDISD